MSSPSKQYKRDFPPGTLITKVHDQAEDAPIPGMIVSQIDYADFVEIMFGDDRLGTQLSDMMMERYSEEWLEPNDWVHYEVMWPDSSITIEPLAQIRRVPPCPHSV